MSLMKYPSLLTMYRKLEAIKWLDLQQRCNIGLPIRYVVTDLFSYINGME